jgi:pyrroline-5-carboxylate reductase
MNTAGVQEILQTLRVGFLGAGSIAEAMLTGICKKNLLSAEQIYVTNREDDSRLHALQSRFGVQTMRDTAALVNRCDTLILAMKPKDAEEACTALRGLVRPEHLIISVIAGVSTELINSWLGVDCPIIRTMPNTSSAIGLSATGIATGRHAGDHHLHIATLLFTSIGTVYTGPDAELASISGRSGSGAGHYHRPLRQRPRLCLLSGGSDGKCGRQGRSRPADCAPTHRANTARRGADAAAYTRRARRTAQKGNKPGRYDPGRS